METIKNYAFPTNDKKEIKSLNNDDDHKMVENGINPEEEKRVNGVIDDSKKIDIQMNGKKCSGDDEENIDEDKLLNEGSVDDTDNSVDDDILNSDEDSKDVSKELNNKDSKDINNDLSNKENENTKSTEPNDDVKSENLNEKIVSETVEQLKEEILKSENTNEQNVNGNDIEGMEVEEILKNKEEVTDNLIENQDAIIPSPIEVNKHTRVSDQQRKISKLREELQCEETKLTLLRKLVESQRGKSVYKNKHQNAMPNLRTKIPAQGNTAPAKQTLSTKSSSQPAQKYYIQVGNQLVPAPPPTTQSGSSAYQYTNGSSAPSVTSQAPPAKPQPPKQTPEQKQNAAKAALRRQLEQTLLQIPPPRPPPADWKVVPNVNSMDFMMLVGLDEVVDMILDIDSKPTMKAALDQLAPFNPRICSQCKIDFSPCWKVIKDTDKTKGSVLCERCSLQNVKKDLKAEHTTRLKSAFLKALKQEQEIEEKIKAGEDVNISSITGEKLDRKVPSPKPQVARMSSPKVVNASQTASNHSSASPTESRSHHHSSSNTHHRHQVVQHYPHHSSLVQQLHHQHIQQQQVELEPPPSSRHTSRWHPYMPQSSSHHHRESHNTHHRSYASNSSENSPHQEYYVVHHPQHAGVRYVSR